MLKIGLLSSHGTGKTTLAHIVAGELKRRGPRVKVIGEMATEARERSMPINERTTLPAQAWILHSQAAEELAAEVHGYDVVVCDRTVLDNYIYLERACGDHPFYRHLALGHAAEHPYGLLYLVPVLGAPVTDGVRSVDADFQREIDDRLQNFLERERIHVVFLPEPHKEDVGRQVWVDRIVGDAVNYLTKSQSRQKVL